MTITQAQVDQLRVGLQQTLDSIESGLIAQVFADQLPLLGTHLADAAAGGVPALQQVSALKDALGNGLLALNGGGPYTEAQVEQALAASLAAAGINTPAPPNLDLSNPADTRLLLTSTKSFAAFDAPLDAGFGLPGLGLESSGTAHTALTYTLNFGVGLDAGGFYLNTANNASLMQAGFATTLSGLDVSANLSRLRFRVTDESALDGDGVAPSSFSGQFALDLLDPGTAGADDKLRISELAGADLLDARLTASANVNLNLASDLGAAVLPDLAADLNLSWGFNNAVVDPGAGFAGFGNLPTLAFNNVSIGLGTFFSSFVDPVFDAVRTLTEPMQPIVDVLLTRIGFLSELAGRDVTLIDLAGGIGALSPETAARLDLFSRLISLINAPRDGGNVRIDLGDFSLGAQDPRSAAFVLADAVPHALGNVLPPGAQSAVLGSFLAEKTALPGGGLSFPIIENPATAINLLFGKPVDFFTYHVPGLDIDEQGFDQFYRIFGPFGVRLQATVEAHATLDIGYDSSGLSQFAASGDAEDIFNGFYVVDHPGPEATLTTQLQAFAAANAVIAEMGVGGGIVGNLLADLNDRDGDSGDGRVHLALLADSCLFELSGELTAGLSAYLTVGWGPFSETFERDLGHEVLLSFKTADCDAQGQPGVPVLAHTVGSSVFVHVGADAALQQIGTLQDSAEDFFVFHVSGAAGNEVVAVAGKGLVSESGNAVAPQDYGVGANGRINANGGEFDDALVLAPDVLSPAALRGGVGNDLLVGGAGDDSLNGDAGQDALVGGGGNDNLNGGAERDLIDGQEGDDSLQGGSDADTLHGGPGADLLDGGPGFDTASYFGAAIGVLINLAIPGSGTSDAQGDTYTSIERYVGSPHADLLFGSAGSDNFGGAAGNDLIDGQQGDDLLSGDGGADTLVGGAGNDFAAYTLSLAAVSVSLLSGLGSGGDAQGDTLSGIENLQGSDFGDTLEGDHGANWLRGLDGNNILRGLGGDDLLEGGKDDDTLEGGDGADTLRASLDVASLDALVSGGNDTLRGGAGNDTLQGDAGGDLLDGGDDNDRLFAGPHNDQLLGGAGDDLLEAGAGNDQALGGAGQDLLRGDLGNDVLDGGDGDDQLDGGPGDDAVFGGVGDDTLFGSDGQDTLDAGSGADVVNGGVGDDWLSVGTLRAAQQDPQRLDRLDGGAGFDAISADFSNQTLAMLVTAGPSQSLVFADGAQALNFETLHDFFSGSGNDTLRLDGAADDGFANFLRTGAGNDTVYAGAGSDNVDAGDGDDLVSGGTNDAAIRFEPVFGTVIGFAGPAEILAGGAGVDTLSFEGFFGTFPAAFGHGRFGVAVDLSTQRTGGAATGITISGFENLVGTDYGDVLIGDDAANLFSPLHGGGYTDNAVTSGPDRIDGRGGIDTLFIDYSREELPGSGGLRSSAGDNLTIGQYGRDTPGSPLFFTDSVRFVAVEQFHIIGTSQADQMTGGHFNHDDELSGLGGDDILGGNAGNDVLLGGEGNDVLSGQGSFAAGYNGAAGGHDVFDGGAGDDLVEDIAFSVANFSAFFLGPNPRFQLDGGSGFDTLSADFSNQSAAIAWDSAAPSNIEFADGAYARNFEQLRFFASGAGDDLIVQAGRINNLFQLGAGDDTINPGLGVDTVLGGPGLDTAVLDFSSGDSAEMAGLQGFGEVDGGRFFRSLLADPFNRPDNVLLIGVERVHVTGTSKSDNITGTWGDDTLIGGAGDDTLAGGKGSDTLEGGSGNDVFAFPRSDAGADTVSDLEVGDRLRFAGVNLSAASFVASPVGLAANKIFVSSADGFTTVHVGVDATPGANVVVRLVGNHPAGSMVAGGTDIWLEAVNRPPTGSATAVLVAGTEDLPYQLIAALLLQGFSDADGDALQVANLVAEPGSVAANGDGSWTFTALPDTFGPVALSYQVVDGRGGSVAAQQSFVLTPVNDPAVLGRASVTVDETDSPIVTGGLLSISDVDSPAAFIPQAASNGLHGVFSISAAGAWAYTARSAFNELNVGDSLVDAFEVSSADGTLTTVSITIAGTVDTTTLRVGDAPLRQSGAGGQWAQAWSSPGLGLWHKADAGNAVVPWSAASLHGVSPQLLTGGDIFGGDLGVSGQSAPTSSVRQEIDGREVLRFTLPAAAFGVTVQLASLFVNDDGTAFSESGLLRLLDSGGQVVAEQAFVADSASGSKTVSLAAPTGFVAVELLSGMYAGPGGAFAYGGYASAAGGFGSAVFIDAAGKWHGSDFLLDWLEFLVPVVGQPVAADPSPFLMGG